MSWTKTAVVLTVSTLVLSLTVAGCEQRAASRVAIARICELEAKSARLEDDCRQARLSRDEALTRAEGLELEHSRLLAQVETLNRIARQSVELKQMVAQRTTERDAMQNHLTQFSRDLRNLATQIEHAANQTPNSAPIIVTSQAIQK